MTPPLATASAIPSALRVTRLRNGLRVASLREPASPFSSLGVYIKAGARHESPSLIGATQLLTSLAFKNSLCVPDAADTVAELGGNVIALATRENMVLQGSVLRDKLSLAMSLFARTLARTRLSDTEVANAAANMLFGLDESRKMPAAYVREFLYEKAFDASRGGIAQNIHRYRNNIERLSPRAVEEYARMRVSPAHMVLVSAGADAHETVVELAERAFGGFGAPHAQAGAAAAAAAAAPASTETEEQVSAYVGGSAVHVMDPPPPTHPNATRALTYMQLAFAAPSSMETRESLGAHVMQFLLGGGDAFSSGGPGKGMYTRLFTDVLNRNRHVESAIAFYESHADCGLFGIQAACDPALNSRMLRVLASEISRVAHERIGAEELARAKNQLRSFMLMALESQLVRIENAGMQLLMRESYLPPAEISAVIDEIDDSYVQTIARRMLESRPTCVVHAQAGHMNNLPDIEAELASVFPRPISRNTNTSMH